MTFEAHITLRPSDRERATPVAEQYGWKTSQICGDPLLGPDKYFYLTMHHENLLAIHDHMQSTLVALAQTDVIAVRIKIELIVYDTKTGKGVGA